MELREQKFKRQSEKFGFDSDYRETINHNILQYKKAVIKGIGYYSSLDNAKKSASEIKEYTLNNLNQLLLKFEKNATKNNIKVLWAKDYKQAIEHILDIVEKEEIKLVVKSKSMISEELDLNKVLEDKGIQSIETDLGEFIIQQANEKPFHIITPAMHKSKEDVAKLFREKFDTPENSSPEFITKFVRKFLREQFVIADMGITGANFLIAETGSIALTENEGNGLMTLSWPKVHLAITGIEKIIPRLSDLDLFWNLLSVVGTGQKITAYNSIISGPRGEGETDGPEKMYLILIDAGRTNIFDQEDHYVALKCIRCGACLNYCPVYKTIGGHAYDTVYSGPIGSVISMYLENSKDTGHLNFASTLCGKCTEVCPVKIPLHHLLLLNRKKLVEEGHKAGFEKTFFRYYKRFMLKRKRLDRVSAKWKNRAMKSLGKKAWGTRRAPLVFVKESFNKRWRNKI